MEDTPKDKAPATETVAIRIDEMAPAEAFRQGFAAGRDSIMLKISYFLLGLWIGAVLFSRLPKA